MARVFKNPLNGHKEKVYGDSWVGVLLLGAIYLAAKGLWGHFLIWILVVGAFTALAGWPGLIIALPVAGIGYAIAIQGILANSYLRKGWIEVSGNDAGILVTGVDSDRTCPLCAETIKSAAIKCKHCGADVEAVAGNVRRPPAPISAKGGWTVRFECKAIEDMDAVKYRISEMPGAILNDDDMTVVAGFFRDEHDAQEFRDFFSAKSHIDGRLYFQPAPIF